MESVKAHIPASMPASKDGRAIGEKVDDHK